MFWEFFSPKNKWACLAREEWAEDVFEEKSMYSHKSRVRFSRQNQGSHRACCGGFEWSLANAFELILTGKATVSASWCMFAELDSWKGSRDLLFPLWLLQQPQISDNFPEFYKLPWNSGKNRHTKIDEFLFLAKLAKKLLVIFWKRFSNKKLWA